MKPSPGLQPSRAGTRRCSRAQMQRNSFLAGEDLSMYVQKEPFNQCCLMALLFLSGRCPGWAFPTPQTQATCGDKADPGQDRRCTWRMHLRPTVFLFACRLLAYRLSITWVKKAVVGLACIVQVLKEASSPVQLKRQKSYHLVRYRKFLLLELQVSNF